jgi:hypothetical protein
MPVPTVKIANPKKPGEYLIINETDFNPAVHTLWVEPVISVAVAIDGAELARAIAPAVVNQTEAYDAPIEDAAPKRSHHAKRSK